MSRKKPSAPLILILGVLSLYACSNNKADDPEQKEEIKPYEVKTLQPERTVRYEEYPASLQGEQEIEVLPKIDGYIENIYVDEGATVRKGQLLFKIFSPQYQQELRTAEAGIKTAEAEVKTANMEVNKVRPLVEKGIISNFALEAAEYTLQAKKAALAQANATLTNAKANLAYTEITSPVNGIMGKLPYKVGSLVSSNSANPLTTLVSSGNTYAYFSLNEKQLLSMTRDYKGDKIQDKLKSIPPVSFVLSDGTIYEKNGRIETSGGIISTETGSMDFRATFPNTANLLRSGASGKIRIHYPLDTALLVPQSATYDLQGKRFVYVVQPDSTVKSTAIIAEATNDGQSFVVQKGLKKGEKVILNGVTELKDGVKIAPKGK